MIDNDNCYSALDLLGVLKNTLLQFLPYSKCASFNFSAREGPVITCPLKYLKDLLQGWKNFFGL